jgi:hypothetical protein
MGCHTERQWTHGGLQELTSHVGPYFDRDHKLEDKEKNVGAWVAAGVDIRNGLTLWLTRTKSSDAGVSTTGHYPCAVRCGYLILLPQDGVPETT